MALRVRAFAVSILAPRIRRQQLMLFSMFPHLFLLVSTNPQRGARFAGTQQYETGVTIFGKIDQGIRLVYFASILQPSCTRQAIALMAKRRQGNACGMSCAPDVFIAAYSNGVLPAGCQQDDVEYRGFGLHLPKLVPPGSKAKRDQKDRFMGCRTARSCCTARVLAPRGGSVRTEWFCRRAPSPAAR